MAYEYYIDPSVNCVFVRALENIPSNATQEILEKLLADPDHQQGMNHLFDTTQTKLPAEWNYKFFKVPGQDLNRDIFHGQKYFKMAWVVADAEDFAKFHQMILSSRFSSNIVERKAFRDIAKAYQWLGIPEDHEIDYS